MNMTDLIVGAPGSPAAICQERWLELLPHVTSFTSPRPGQGASVQYVHVMEVDGQIHVQGANIDGDPSTAYVLAATK